ncbi:hypothetical protein [Microbacterium sp. bgisy207]|uniref:hypothetical protein n=1 Tax=Microbacterium sp. bgisy207 TaxID=3413800 RepID=UPI003EC14EDD
MHRGIAVLAVGFVGVLGLAGCSAPSEPYSVFQRTPTAADTIPAAVDEGNAEFELSDARYVGEHDGKRLWIARIDPESGMKVCLVVYPDDESWVTGCGGGGEVAVSGMDGVEYHLVPDGSSVPDEVTVISENVYVVD